jgi:hypothetical protein
VYLLDEPCQPVNSERHGMLCHASYAAVILTSTLRSSPFFIDSLTSFCRKTTKQMVLASGCRLSYLS